MKIKRNSVHLKRKKNSASFCALLCKIKHNRKSFESRLYILLLQMEVCPKIENVQMGWNCWNVQSWNIYIWYNYNDIVHFIQGELSQNSPFMWHAMSGQHCCMESRRGPSANVTAAPGSIRNVDPQAHFANKLDKTHYERGSDSYRRYQKVTVWNGKEEKSVIFRACHETWLPAKEGMDEGKRGRGRPRLQWSDNITQWTSLTFEKATHTTQHRKRWRFVTGNVNRHATL